MLFASASPASSGPTAAASVEPEPASLNAGTSERSSTPSSIRNKTSIVVNQDNGADYRVAFFGAGGVGKSSIVQRFVNGTFSDNYVPTIEDTYQQVISCNQKNVCTLQITDTTGSHQFPAMQRLSVSKGHAFVLVYSVTSLQSYNELIPIVLMLQEVKGSALSDSPIMLVGNKKDEESRREVEYSKAEKLATKWGIGCIETSAKNNENITELFKKLLAMEKKRQLALTMNDTEEKGNNKKKCSIM
uniref:GTP-binding protein Di-Ras2 n=1 Tax=Panagrolaimus davidi TaxID=227884 RepID=A0A914QH10_9BILA